MTMQDDLVEFNGIIDQIGDEHLRRLSDQILSIMRSPDLAPAKAQAAVAQLEAFAYYFAIKKHYYMSLRVKTDTDKLAKNVMFSAQESCQRMADAMKYVARNVG